ncbi:MAG: ribosome small subunit-dependent GTPase A [Planctomycetota bacterium]|jgi:ribosome biogenesis GTPase
MSSPSRKRRGGKGRKVRVDLRRNRAKPRRVSDWTRQAREADGHEFDSRQSESIVAKGDLSRRRTIVVRDDQDAPGADLHRGTVIAMRGLYADVDDGQRILPCTVRRMLRTRLIEERHPVTVGDRVHFQAEAQAEGVEQEGVIEAVEQRRGQLRRRTGRRTHTIVANVDQAIVVSSASEPPPKAHLIDRYVVALHAGDIVPVICMNKADLDRDKSAAALLERYARLGYGTLLTSVVTGEEIDALRNVLKDKVSVVAGQSGVGKSSLLNAVQPGLRLRTGDIIEQLQKGRHTTSNATMLRLKIGGYVVDTPGVRSFDISMVPRNEFEAYFVEFLDHVSNCKFPDCTHIHEDDCAIIQAVEGGDIHADRYESYVRLFEDSGESA